MIIDSRMRPLYGSFAAQFAPEACEPFFKKLGMEMPPSVKQGSEALMLQEMDEAGIDIGIAPSRFIGNKELEAMVAHYQGRFIGLASIDGDNTIRENLEIVERHVVNGRLKGVHFEPGHSLKVPRKADDPVFYPIYEYCQEKSIVVAVMLGGNNGPNLVEHTNPAIITRLARDFPDVRWFVCHGGWPWVTEILGVCFWYENIWIESDLYLYGAPGWREYVDAANGFLQDRFMFSSGYPLLPLKETVDGAKALFKEEVLDKIMFKNAAELFGIDLEGGK